jgi:hypothetical protein
MLSGILPNDEKWVGGVITSISYLNAKEYLSI